MTTFTQQIIDEAASLGMTPEEYSATLAVNDLQKGTYDFQIISGKVFKNDRDGVMKDSLEVNLSAWVLDGAGMPVKRYQLQRIKFVLPVSEGSFVPNAISKEQGIKALRWLSSQTGIAVPELVNSFKALQVPGGLLMKTVRGYFYHRQDKKDASKSYPTILPAKATDKVTALPAGPAIGAATGSSVAVHDDNSIPF